MEEPTEPVACAGGVQLQLPLDMLEVDELSAVLSLDTCGARCKPIQSPPCCAPRDSAARSCLEARTAAHALAGRSRISAELHSSHYELRVGAVRVSRLRGANKQLRGMQLA